MIDVFFFSIAGKKTNQFIDDLIITLKDSEYTPNQEKKLLAHCQEVAKEGNYPSHEYFQTFYAPPAFTYKSLAEIANYTKKIQDNYKFQHIQKKIISSINESETSNQLLERLESLTIEKDSEVDDLVASYRPVTYQDTLDRPYIKGLDSGIPEFDSITNGFQPGTIGSACGFTGHGKSTFAISFAFKNVKAGKKGIILSLELSPELVFQQLEARYMYEVKGLSITGQDLIHRKLSSDIAEKVKEYDSDFREEICSNLVVLDESYISKAVMLNYKAFSKLVKSFEKMLGGLDFIIFDHVGQLELMYPDCGNMIIKQIQSFTKTYVDSRGVKPFSLFCVQTNREGEKRARKRNGQYDLQAISDLNEVERSSTYVLFIYASDDMKVVQECKMTLSKHRLGPVLTEPVVTSFNPAVYTVGSTIDKIEVSDDVFNSMGSDFNFSDDAF